jgi:hypothetical protein
MTSSSATTSQQNHTRARGYDEKEDGGETRKQLRSDCGSIATMVILKIRKGQLQG